MENTRKVLKELYYIGASDTTQSTFENHYPTKKGMSYNSYLLLDDKNILFDTVDDVVRDKFFENLNYLLAGKQLDYLFVHHAEPDHTENIQAVLELHKECVLVLNQKTLNLINQFYDYDFTKRALVVKEGDILETKNYKFTFVNAPMVHWPEVMMSYELNNDILFSADAFGAFYGLKGYIFSDEIDFEHDMLPESRRYYFNIVGKYGLQVTSVFNKLVKKGLAPKLICPLHGVVYRHQKDVDCILDKYKTWASFEAEDNDIVIVYASIYGNTEKAIESLETKLAENGVTNVKAYDVTKIDESIILAECFRAKNLVFASVTYNNEIFTGMENLIRDLKAHNFQNRNVSLIQNGSWAPQSAKKMRALFSEMKNITVDEDEITIKSSVSKDNIVSLENLAKTLKSRTK